MTEPQYICAVGECNNVADRVASGWRVCSSTDCKGLALQRFKPRAQRVEPTPAEAIHAARVCVHKLKTWPSVFEEIVSGNKTAEFRLNDRDFAVGDELLLMEWDPDAHAVAGGAFTGREYRVRVMHVVHGGQFGIPEHFCMMSVRRAAIVTGLRDAPAADELADLRVYADRCSEAIGVCYEWDGGWQRGPIEDVERAIREACQHSWELVNVQTRIADLRTTCARALERFGNDAQVLQAIEECAELIVALRHATRGKAAPQAVIVEIADVAIMVEQLTQMFGRDRVEAEIERKLARLAHVIERQERT